MFFLAKRFPGAITDFTEQSGVAFSILLRRQFFVGFQAAEFVRGTT